MDLDDARALAIRLMAEHGLDGWRLVVDGAKRRAGVCRPARREIGLSRHLTALHDAEQVRDTVLHEIAHALVGPQHGHDVVWRATARRIGCSGERCLAPDVPQVEGDWVGTCPAGHRTTLHRRPQRVRSCATCAPGRFDPAALLTWTHRGRAVPMHPRYEAELAVVRGQVRGRHALRVLAPARPTATVRAGAQVRLLGGGTYGGLVGTVERVGRTRYRVETDRGLLSVPFEQAELLFWGDD